MHFVLETAFARLQFLCLSFDSLQFVDDERRDTELGGTVAID